MIPLAEADPAALELGTFDRPLGLADRSDNQAAVDLLLAQARQRVELFTPDMEPWLYDRSQVVEALHGLVLRSRHGRLRVLTIDTERAIKDGHRLVELARRLSSYAEIRRVHEDYRDTPETFLLADEAGMLRRPVSGRPEGQLLLRVPMEVRQKRAWFDEVWERSTVDPQLRRLYL